MENVVVSRVRARMAREWNMAAIMENGGGDRKQRVGLLERDADAGIKLLREARI